MSKIMSAILFNFLILISVNAYSNQSEICVKAVVSDINHQVRAYLSCDLSQNLTFEDHRGYWSCRAETQSGKKTFEVFTRPENFGYDFQKQHAYVDYPLTSRTSLGKSIFRALGVPNTHQGDLFKLFIGTNRPYYEKINLFFSPHEIQNIEFNNEILIMTLAAPFFGRCEF